MKKSKLTALITLFLFLTSACSTRKDTVLPAIRMLVYNNSYYEITAEQNTLAKTGISLGNDAAGEHIAWLAETGDGFEISDIETETELLSYRNTEQRAVMIINEKGNLSAAIFGNFLTPDTDTSYDFEKLFSLYGIHESNDITAVYKTDWDRNNIKSESVKELNQIGILYNLLIDSKGYGNDSFQQIRFGDIDEEKQPQEHKDFADDLNEVCIETKDGLKLYLGFYPSSGWIDGYGSMAWYRMSDKIMKWYNENIR